MITATDLEVRAGARTLLSTDGAALRVQPGDRIGLVGRNGAGKTTTMRILAGEGEPYAGTIARSGEIGYLPQDPKEGNLEILARDRVLSARGLDTLLSDLEKQQALMAEVADDSIRDRAVRRYGQLEERFAALRSIYVQDDPWVDVERDEHGVLLVERNCPFLDVATRRPALCAVTVNTLSRLLGRRVERVRTFQAGHGRCAFRVTDEAIDRGAPFQLERPRK